MPANYAVITPKKFLDAYGLGYYSQELNKVIAAIIDGIQDVLDEKLFVEEYDEYDLFPSSGRDMTVYIDTSASAVYRWNGTEYVRLNPFYTPITNAQIDSLFE